MSKTNVCNPMLLVSPDDSSRYINSSPQDSATINMPRNTATLASDAICPKALGLGKPDVVSRYSHGDEINQKKSTTYSEIPMSYS